MKTRTLNILKSGFTHVELVQEDGIFASSLKDRAGGFKNVIIVGGYPKNHRNDRYIIVPLDKKSEPLVQNYLLQNAKPLVVTPHKAEQLPFLVLTRDVDAGHLVVLRAPLGTRLSPMQDRTDRSEAYVYADGRDGDDLVFLISMPPTSAMFVTGGKTHYKLEDGLLEAL
jgi:hypothetical protein